MFSTTLLTVLLTAVTAVVAGPGQLEQRAACNADNCLRAVRGTAGKSRPTQGIADCLSFFQTTVTPCVTTIVTSIVTVAAGQSSQQIVKQDVLTCPAASRASILPSSVNRACAANTSRYSSACACAGITSYSTKTASTVTFTSTVTATSTLTPSPTVTTASTLIPSSIMTASSTITPSVDRCSLFILQATEGPFVGDYLVYNSTSNRMEFDTTDPKSATQFTFDDQSRVALVSDPTQVWASDGRFNTDIYLADIRSLPPLMNETTSMGNLDLRALVCSAFSPGFPIFGTLNCQGWDGSGYDKEAFEICLPIMSHALQVNIEIVSFGVAGDCVESNVIAIPLCYIGL